MITSHRRAAGFSLVLLLTITACSGVFYGLTPSSERLVTPLEQPASRPAGCELEQVASLPVEKGVVWSVAVELNGVPARLALDTGAERTAVAESSAQRLGLTVDPQHQTHLIGITGTATTADASVSGLSIGGQSVPLSRVGVQPLPALERLGTGLDGFVGSDVLSAFDIDLDTRSNRLTLYRAKPCPAAGPPWQEAYVSLGAVSQPRGHRRLDLPIVVDGTPATAFLDTGAQNSIIGKQIVDRLGLTDADMTFDRNVISRGATAGMAGGHLHGFRMLQVGPIRFDGPVLVTMQLPPSLPTALVGTDFLAGRRVWLSYASLRVFVTSRIPNAP